MTIWSPQANLNKGELDPTLRGRIDTDLYYNGLEKATNVLLKPQGGVKKRPGTRHVATITSEQAILEPFSFNDETNYLLHFEIPKTTDTSKIYIYKEGVLQTNINGSGNDYLDLTLTLTGFFGKILRDSFYYIQSANTALIFADGQQPVQIARTSDTAWTAARITFTNVPQYDFNDASSPAPTSEVQRFTLNNMKVSDRFKISIDGFLSDELTFSADNTENENRIKNAVQEMTVTGRDGVTVSHVLTTAALSQYDVTFGGGSAAAYGLMQAIPVLVQLTNFDGESVRLTPGVSAKEDAFGSTRGWPRTGVFHQSRLWVGGTESLPDAIFGSMVGDFFNYDQGRARDDEAIFITLQTDQVNKIQALTSTRKLQVFTSGAEFYCPEDTITPSNIRFDVSTNYGTKNLKPTTLDGAIIFAQNEGRALVISEVINQFQPIQSRNLGVLAPHLLNNIIEIALSRGNEDTDANYIYCLNSDGKVACLNYLVAEGVEGFSTWELGGDNTEITSIAVVDKVLYLATKRGTEYFIEQEDEAYPVDCGVEITSSSTVDTSHFTGTIEVKGDGAYLGEFTSGASVTLPRTVTSGHAGIPYRPTVRGMPLTQGLANGSSWARKKRIRRAIIEYYLSNGITVKSIADGVVSATSQIPDKTLGVDQFEAPVPASALKRVPLSGYGLQVQLEVTQVTPMDFFILGMGAEVNV